MKLSFLTPLIIGVTLSFSANAVNTVIYQSVGKHGETRYTQIQPKDTQNFQVLEMRSDGRTNDAGQLSQLPEQATPPNAQAQENEALRAENDALKNQELVNRCQSLRANFANLTIGGRIFETNAQGEKVYLNDQEISSKRQQHQQMIAQYCNNV